MFGPRRDEATGEWRRLYNEEHYVLYLAINIIRLIKSRRMEWGRRVTRMRDGRVAYKIVVERPERRRPLRRPRSR